MPSARLLQKPCPYYLIKTHTFHHTHTHRGANTNAVSHHAVTFQKDVPLGLSPLPCLADGHSRINPRTFLRNAAAHETAKASARQARATMPQLVQQHVRNTDDLKRIQMRHCISRHMVQNKLQAGCCAYFPSNSIMHKRDNTDLGMPTSCPETRLSLSC